MQEKDFQTRFNKWCKYNITQTSCFELKLTKTKSVSFSQLQEHQMAGLYAAKHSKLIYKIPDTGFQNPFDSVAIMKSQAFVVVMFYERGTREFFLIDIDTWINEVKVSKRKSLTEDRAREIGKKCSFDPVL